MKELPPRHAAFSAHIQACPECNDDKAADFCAVGVELLEDAVAEWMAREDFKRLQVAEVRH